MIDIFLKVLGVCAVIGAVVALLAAVLSDPPHTPVVYAVETVVPQMERVGEVAVGRNRVHLWSFKFDGRQCLWATSQGGSWALGGLTCDWTEDGLP